MAWNQPNVGKRTKPIKRNNKAFVYAAVAIAVATVGFTVFLLIPSSSKNEKQSNKKSKTTEDVSGKISKAKVLQPSPVQPSDKPEKHKERPPQRVGELRDGYRLLPDGTLHRVLGIVTNTPPKISLADKTFTHSADVELGNLLMVEPGDDLLGSAEGMYRGFGKELDEALEDPIVYDRDDTDVQRELKDAVKELREELVRRRAAGENIEKVMEDTWNQLKELSLYRQDLEDQVRNLSADSITQADYEDLVKAANDMLAERGIKALEMPSTLKRTLRLRKIQEEAAMRQKERENSNEAE